MKYKDLTYKRLRMEGVKTMSEHYKERNDHMGRHLCCPKCTLCITCGDCNCKTNEKELLKIKKR